MAVPKRRITKRRQGERRNSNHGKPTVKQSATCSNCGAKVMSHKICANCGYYRGKKILAKLV